MALLKNTIFIALLLFFSLKFAKCQENTEGTWGGWGETAVTETTTEKTESTYEEWYPPLQEEVVWETTPTEEMAVNEETTPVEEVVVVEEETIEEGPAGGCPRFIEETEVNGHWMTLHPCCVSSETACSSSFEPVCIEELRCEADHCRRHYETVTNVCLACKGQGNWMYSIGECPWEKSAF